jgi:hypothetical protein
MQISALATPGQREMRFHELHARQFNLADRWDGNIEIAKVLNRWRRPTIGEFFPAKNGSKLEAHGTRKGTNL